MPETETNLFLVFTRRLDTLEVPYMITGSVASTIYGDPRLTNDVDVVIELPRALCTRFEQVFPLEEFYCPPLEVLLVEIARAQRGHFNLIHHATGFKADIYPVGHDQLARWGLAHARSMVIEGSPVSIAPPEYVIIRKLQFFSEGGSEKHLRDVAGMLASSDATIDSALVEEHVNRLGLTNAWERAKATT